VIFAWKLENSWRTLSVLLVLPDHDVLNGGMAAMAVSEKLMEGQIGGLGTGSREHLR